MIPALTNNRFLDTLTIRRDLQKLRHGWLAPTEYAFVKIDRRVVGWVWRHHRLSAHTSGPLAARQICTKLAVYQDFANARARVLQPVPATVPSLQNTCFFAHPDTAI